ncbi:MAG: ABC transporter permease subunit, partial [Deltaproteobacteria bacterium]|nr:ABC transporter permease subunit [Deltaproteobacteria bacterium]
MLSYIIHRLVLIIPTIWAIITLNFFIIQIAPGGPVDQMIAEMQGITSNMVMERISGVGQQEVGKAVSDASSPGGKQDAVYRGARGLDPEVIEEIKKRFGFDKPVYVRYVEMLWRYIRFEFGESLFRGKKVVTLIIERMPVSISLGLWSTLIIYLVSIPLGIKKAIRHCSHFDVWSSTVIIVGNAIPVFLFAILLIILFAGGTYLKIFPLRGLVSTNFEELNLFRKVLDYFWHISLPVIATVIGGFATLTMLTKNSFLDEIHKQYVLTARAKGLTEKRILMK